MVEYYITDGHGKYLKANASGNYVPVSGNTIADSWGSRSKAKNVLMNCINKNLRSKYYIEEIEQPDPVVIVSSDPTAAVAECQEKQTGASNDLDGLIQGLASFTEFFESAEDKKDMLVNDLSLVDREVSDIYHYIENGKFNAYQGWQVFDLLQKTLRRRRKIKNELSVLTELFKCNVSSASIENVIDYAKNIGSHTYTPRVLTDLFK